MRKKIIAKNLKKVLLEGGAFSHRLFGFELEDRIKAYLESKHEDGDKYLFVIAEKSNGIAMMLIDENDRVHVNEEARAVLMKFWKGENYKNNILLFMPDMANELDKGNHYFAGVKVVERGRKKGWFSLPRLFS
ncbi:MAG: hypothetical protein DKINENOH_01910 [bacterium]|nr:hypothetical protein [bacterium]